MSDDIIIEIVNEPNDVIEISHVDGTATEIFYALGEQGPAGPIGPTGATGPTGPQGTSYTPGDPVYVIVRNATGSPLSKGTIVYVSGANGTHTQVTPALASSDATSARTLGWLAEDISNNASGLCCIEGYVEGINTHGITEGVQLYLSPTVAGGFTSTKPSAPNHMVYVGVCAKASAGNGKVFVKVQNGYELEELHDVAISSPTDNQVLTYEASTGLWKNKLNPADGVTQITASAPLTGGTITSTGTIGLDQTALSITPSQVAGTAVVTSDSRLSDSRTPTGNAGGDLTGTYPNPTIAAGVIVDADVNATANIAQSKISGLVSDLSGKANLTGGNTFSGTQTFSDTITHNGFFQNFNNMLSSGRATIGLSSLSSGVQFGVYSASTTNIGAIIRGANGQTANLQEWQSWNGTTATTVGVVTPTGTFRTAGLVSVGDAVNVLGQLSVTTTATSRIGAVIRGASGQTANLTEWQSWDGTTATTVASMSNTGTASMNGAYISQLWAGAGISAGTLGRLNVSPFSAGQVGAVIRGVSGQTANLSEWQTWNGTTATTVASISNIGNLTVGANLTFTNPGVGNETKINFAKTSDQAWLTVLERSSDSTTYEFGMADNPDGGDYFQWRFNDWQNPGTGWMPLQITANTNRFIGKVTSMFGNMQLPYNTGFYTYNNTSVTADNEVNKYLPTNSTTNQVPKDFGTGTGTLAVNASAFTGTGATPYWVVIDGTGTFKWGTGSYIGTPTATGVVITGSAQTLSNGLTITLSLTGHVLNDRWSFSAYPTPQFAIGAGAFGSVTSTIWTRANFIGQVIRGSVSQTANLQEWQTWNGTTSTIVARVGTDGSITTTNLNAVSPHPTYDVITSRAVSGQTGNLFLFMASDTTAIGGRNRNAQIFTGSTAPLTSSIGGTIQSIATGANPLVTMASNHNLVAGDIVTLSGTTGGTYDGTFIVSASTPASTTFNITTTLTTGQAAAGGTVVVPAQTSIVARSGATVALNVRGASNQTASFMEVQNSSATTLLRVNTSGYVVAPLGLIGGGSTQSTNTSSILANNTMYATASNQIALAVRGAGSQAQNLFEVQNSSGTPLMTIDSSGQIRTPTLINPNTFNNSRLQMQNTGILVDTQVTTNVPMAVRGASGQTADMQVWQTWDGTTATTRARVDSGGNFKAVNVATLNSIGQMAESNSGALFVMGRATAQASSPGLNTGTLYFRDGTTTGTLRLATRTGASGVEETIVDNLSSTGSTAGAQFVGAGGVNTTGRIITNLTSDVVGATVRGFNGQTVNLQEWQSWNGTAATTVAGITSGGRGFFADGITSYVVRGGDGLTAIVVGNNRNVQFGSSGGSGVGGGQSVIGIANATTVPTSNPSAGGILYVDTGALKYMGTSGSAATIVNADGTMSGGGSFTGGILTGSLTLRKGGTASGTGPLYFDSTSASTDILATPVTGVREFDGTVFYATPNATPGRAVDVDAYYYVSNSDYGPDFTTTSTAKSLLGGATTGISVAAGTTYEYELYTTIQHQYITNTGITGTYVITSSTVSGSPIVAVTHQIDYGSNTTNFTTATTLSTVRTTGSVTFSAAISSGSRYNFLRAKGIIRVTGTGVAKIYPSMSTSAASGDNIWTVQSGTVFKLTPIGNGTVTTVGTWA